MADQRDGHRSDPTGGASEREPTPLLMTLDDDEARRVGVNGAKAAALARMRSGGVHTLPGVVLTTEVSRHYADGESLADMACVDEALAAATAERPALVVRSSSVVALRTIGTDSIRDVAAVNRDSSSRAFEPPM